MNKRLHNFKLFIQFSFFKIVIIWAKAVQYTIGELWCWADVKHKELQDKVSQSLIEEEQENEINDFVKSMQRQAKITGSRPKKDI
jgi:hypothetical protein